MPFKTKEIFQIRNRHQKINNTFLLTQFIYYYLWNVQHPEKIQNPGICRSVYLQQVYREMGHTQAQQLCLLCNHQDQCYVLLTQWKDSKRNGNVKANTGCLVDKEEQNMRTWVISNGATLLQRTTGITVFLTYTFSGHRACLGYTWSATCSSWYSSNHSWHCVDSHTNRAEGDSPDTYQGNLWLQATTLTVSGCKSWWSHSLTNLLTPWLMEPGGSMPHSQGLFNNSYPEPNQPNSPHWYLSLQGQF